MGKSKNPAEQFQEMFENCGVTNVRPFRHDSLVDDYERFLDPDKKISPINDGETEAEYFCRLLNNSDKARETVKIHEKWKRRHLNGLRELDCKHRILIVLKELLNSDFLRYDWFDTGIPKEDQKEAAQELCEQGFEDLLQIEGAEWKFALLGQLRDPEESRIVIEEHKAGFYISEMCDKLSYEAVESFFRFVTFTRLAYQEIDLLKKENRDCELKECLVKMTTDLEPLREHVVSDFVECYDEMLDEILQVGDLHKKLKRVSPNTFKGGYNQKLICNLVGLLCHEDVYDVNPKQADALIYIEKTHYTYINNYANYNSTDSELTLEEVQFMKEIIKKHT